MQCTIGTEPKPSSPSFFWVDQALFLSFLALKWARISAVLNIFLPTKMEEVAVLCATEPVVPEAPSLLTWTEALLVPISAAAAEVRAYVSATFQSWIWSQYCQCTLETPTTGTVCRTWTVATLTPSYQRMHLPDLSVIGHFTGTPPSSGTFYVETSANLEMAFMVYPDGTLGSQTFELSTGIGSHSTSTQSLNPAYPYYGIQARSIGGATSGPATITFCFNGTSDPAPVYVDPDPVIPPEIPDAPTVHVCTSLDQVCAAINELRLEMEAMFRALPGPRTPGGPTAFTYAPAHTSLTGNGSFSVSDILGLLVECDIPSTWGRTPETPFRAIPNVGHVQFAIGGVPEDAHQVRYAHQVIHGPPIGTDSVIYNFAPGITGTVTPIVPEPVGLP